MGNLKIISRSDRPFRDRREAGQRLAEQLSELRGQRAVVLGIPRGGVVIAQEIASAINGEVDVALAHKLRAPGHPELAIGALAESGKVYLNKPLVGELAVTDDYLEQERAFQQEEIARRSRVFRKAAPRIPLRGRVVVVTDDGVATGATTQAALWAVREEEPLKFIAAMPVGPEDTLRRLSENVDEFLCLRVPPYFAAIGQFYLRFDQVEDEEVLQILEKSRRSRSQKS